MSDMILKFFFIALNSKTDWTLQNLPTEIVNKNMKRFNPLATLEQGYTVEENRDSKVS